MAVIAGRDESVQAAEEMLKKVIEEKMRMKEEEETVSMAVPSIAVGRIIGRQGANIRTLQRESGAAVSIPVGGEGREEVECVIRGGKEQIARAVALLQETVQASHLAHKRKVLRQREELRDRHRMDGPPQLQFSSLPNTGDYFGAFVSSVDADGSVWVQVVEGQDPTLLDNLVAEMTEDYSKVQSTTYTVPTL